MAVGLINFAIACAGAVVVIMITVLAVHIAQRLERRPKLRPRP